MATPIRRQSFELGGLGRRSDSAPCEIGQQLGGGQPMVDAVTRSAGTTSGESDRGLHRRVDRTQIIRGCSRRGYGADEHRLDGIAIRAQPFEDARATALENRAVATLHT